MPADINSELPPIEQEPAPATSMRAVILGSLVAAALALVLFSWFAEEVFKGGAARFDDLLRAWVHQFASPPLTRAMMAISALGSVGLAAVFIAAMAIFLRLRWRRAAMWLLFTMAGGLVLELILKNVFHRPRPTPFFGPVPYTYSFPSGHSLMAFCIYGVLAGLLAARIRSGAIRILLWTLAAVLVAAIGLTRVYLGVHYPSDVIAGYLAAAVWVSTLIAADRVRKRKQLHARNGSAPGKKS